MNSPVLMLSLRLWNSLIVSTPMEIEEIATDITGLFCFNEAMPMNLRHISEKMRVIANALDREALRVTEALLEESHA